MEEISPPINTKARGEINGLLLSAIGISPPMAVKLVRTIGRNLSSPDSLMASSRLFPSALNWLVKSTNKIDGTWVNFYHWSEAEGKHWNADIKKMTDSQWKELVDFIDEAIIFINLSF